MVKESLKFLNNYYFIVLIVIILYSRSRCQKKDHLGIIRWRQEHWFWGTKVMLNFFYLLCICASLLLHF